MKPENIVETEYLQRIRQAHTKHQLRARDIRKSLAAKRKELEAFERRIIAEFEAEIQGSLELEEADIKEALAWRRSQKDEVHGLDR